MSTERSRTVIVGICAVVTGLALGYLMGKGNVTNKSSLTPNDAVTIGYRNQAGVQKTATLRVEVANTDEGQLAGYYLVIASPTTEDRQVIRLRPPANWPD